WSGNIGLQYDLKPMGSAGINSYFFGQLGTHYKQAYLTNPGVGWYCDPWWGICYPVGVDVIDAKKTDTAFGANVGFGLGWPMMHGTEFYVELKYQWVNGDAANIDYVPIMIG